MAKYRKKPVVIEAFQFAKDNFLRSKMPAWLKQAMSDGQVVLWSQYGGEVIGGEIKTLEGTMEVSENDYIIKGIQGEFYPCKPDIFEKSYESVD
jgi:hypothetical protein